MWAPSQPRRVLTLALRTVEGKVARVRIGLLTTTALIWGLLACGGQLPTPQTRDQTPVLVPGTVPDGKDGTEPVAPEPPVPTQPGPCADACLLLLDHDYDELVDGKYCKICESENPEACREKWPEDPLTCERVDWLRNCIYARLGYEFDTKPDWRRKFDAESWYKPDRNFSWDKVTPVQASNAKRLRSITKKRKCKR